MSIKRWIWAPAIALAFVVGGCDVDQTEEGEMPSVEVEGGEMPEYDVDVADVDVTTDTQVIVTPDIDVNPPEDDDGV